MVPNLLLHVALHGSQFAKTDYRKIEEKVCGPTWCWTQRGDRLVPSLSNACSTGQLNWFLVRSLWETGQIASEPCFYHHTGCNGISPYGAKNLPYTHPHYGIRQTAEALLLYGNGLALVGRSKVYFDEPRGFIPALRNGETFGNAWAKYYLIESGATSAPKASGDINRKRAYFWSVLGDWSLKLTTASPKERS